MNLYSGNPYWLFHTPLLYTYHSLTKNIQTEIAVIGAGISGALTAYELVKAGYKVCILSDKHIGTGSTVASTGLLQYEIDTPLYKLIEKTGKETAARSYLLCAESINTLNQIHRELRIGKLFQKRKSLLLASRLKDIEGLKKEYEARKEIGLPVKWLDNNAAELNFGFAAPAAIYSNHAAQIDAYRLTQELIHWCAQNGAQVFDKAVVKSIQHSKQIVTLRTTDAITIKAKYAVMATGYEAVNWINRNIARLHSTYAIITEPFEHHPIWKDECLIWETARPYLYFRTTTDGRIIAGGKDEPFASAGKRDKLIRIKSQQLIKALKRKFPGLQLKVEHAWSGTFAETPDGLPYIGAIKSRPRILFALGFGGNGITFSQIAAELIHDIIARKNNPDIPRFRFDRPSAK